ncbi:MAG: cytochrome c peroxidase [Flavobacteriales bacterium]
MTIKKTIVFSVILSIVGLIACSKEQSEMTMRTPNLPSTVYKYDSIGGQVLFDPTDGFQVDNEKATLGRVLFYDTQLSRNNRVSCASCHKQAYGFADNRAKSFGYEDILTDRNSPAILNAGLQSAFFHDLRELHLENMVLQPIAHHVEMGLIEPEYLADKIQYIEYYKPLFISAFGDENVTRERISEGLVNFIRSMISVDSKYDRGQLNNFADFTQQELIGKDLYFHGLPCSACHGGNNLNGGSSAAENIGLDSWYSDTGMIGTDPVSGQTMNGWFKVPSLRNIEVTGPYMHDGRFQTIEEVVEFYNSGIQNHTQLSFMLRKNTNGGFFFLGQDPQDIALNEATGVQPLRMHMTTEEKQALVAFMKTFTDWNFLNDPRFSDPFK